MQEDLFLLWNPKHQQLNKLPSVVFDWRDHTVLKKEEDRNNDM